MKTLRPKKSQIKIESLNLDADKAVVENILLTAKAKFNLYDNSHTSRVPNTIRSIVEGDGYGFGLGARVANGFIFVDFNQWRNDSSTYREVHDFIVDALKRIFQLELVENLEDDPKYLNSY